MYAYVYAYTPVGSLYASNVNLVVYISHEELVYKLCSPMELFILRLRQL